MALQCSKSSVSLFVFRKDWGYTLQLRVLAVLLTHLGCRLLLLVVSSSLLGQQAPRRNSHITSAKKRSRSQLGLPRDAGVIDLCIGLAATHDLRVQLHTPVYRLRLAEVGCKRVGSHARARSCNSGSAISFSRQKGTNRTPGRLKYLSREGAFRVTERWKGLPFPSRPPVVGRAISQRCRPLLLWRPGRIERNKLKPQSL